MKIGKISTGLEASIENFNWDSIGGWSTNAVNLDSIKLITVFISIFMSMLFLKIKICVQVILYCILQNNQIKLEWIFRLPSFCSAGMLNSSIGTAELPFI